MSGTTWGHVAEGKVTHLHSRKSTAYMLEIARLLKVSTPRAFLIESDHESSDIGDDDATMPPARPSVPVSLPEDHHHPGYVPIRLYLILQKLEMVL